MIFIVELIIFGSLSEAEDVNVLIFESLIVEDLDIVEFVDGVDKTLIVFGKPAALSWEDVFALGVFVVKLMVAKTDEDGGNFCESL